MNPKTRVFLRNTILSLCEQVQKDSLSPREAANTIMGLIEVWVK